MPRGRLVVVWSLIGVSGAILAGVALSEGWWGWGLLVTMTGIAFVSVAGVYGSRWMFSRRARNWRVIAGAWMGGGLFVVLVGVTGDLFQALVPGVAFGASWFSIVSKWHQEHPTALSRQ